MIVDDLSYSDYNILERLSELTGTEIYFELGDVRGYSVLELINAFEEVS